MVSRHTRIVYSEVDAFLNLLDDETRNKVPSKVLELFKREKDKEYVKYIDPDVPIKYQNLYQETIDIIAFLHLNYWCKDENERQRLIQVYKENGKKQNEEMWKKLGF